MLAAFNVTQVPGLNLNETNLFIDPMNPDYRAVGFNQADFVGRTGPFSAQSIQAKVDFFTALDAYADVEKVEAELEAFWNAKNVTKAKRDLLEGKGGKHMLKGGASELPEPFWNTKNVTKAKRNLLEGGNHVLKRGVSELSSQ
jgi:hypothetical protein